VLNRGEAVNPLKRSIYVGRVSSYQAKQHEEMQASADALSLLANLVMAWNTMKMRSVLDHWNARRAAGVPPELIGRIAPSYQFVRRVHLSDRAIQSAVVTVTFSSKITGLWCSTTTNATSKRPVSCEQNALYIQHVT
jgi:hypothetical protein